MEDAPFAPSAVLASILRGVYLDGQGVTIMRIAGFEKRCKSCGTSLLNEGAYAQWKEECKRCEHLREMEAADID